MKFMEYLRDVCIWFWVSSTLFDTSFFHQTWIGRIKDADCIPAARKKDFVTQVFWNLLEIIVVNTRLRDALSKRQRSYAVVDRIGDIFMESVPHFGPFVDYGAHQVFGRYEFEKEKNSNLAFAQFVEVRRLPHPLKPMSSHRSCKGYGAASGIP